MFNHAFTIGFEVISEKEDASDVTAAMIRAAITKRIDDLGDLELLEAADHPFDTFETD
jgi:hypothetical protein